MPAHHARSAEGFTWSHKDGLSRGLQTEGFIQPSAKLADDASTTIFDAIVIGAGYAGLTATRDLTLSGHRVLLLEGRDRIGGRTWTSSVDGEKFEMGGTWIHWQQGFVWRELARYGIERDIKVTPNDDFPDFARNKTTSNGQLFDQDFAENFELLNGTLTRFCDVDGKKGTSIVSIAPQVMDGILVDKEAVKRVDKLSCADRLAEMRADGSITEAEVGYLMPFIQLSFGASLKDCSLLELIKWYQHGNQSYYFLGTTLYFYKLKEGQSHLARKIFDEAESTGRLSYSFTTPVQSVTDSGGIVEVQTVDGTFKAKRVVSTLPMNVANKVKFSPELPPLKKEAFDRGHVNKGLKIHHEMSQPGFRSSQWTVYNDDPDRQPVLRAAYGDQLLQNGNSSIVSFGAANDHDRPSETPSKLPEWIGEFSPDLKEHYQRSIWHEWNHDPYALGTWCMFSPEMYTKYWEALQQRTGNVLWASADWADGWKSFIDGAIEQGTKAAYIIKQELLTKSN